MENRFQKLFRYTRIYGIFRAMVKAIGRSPYLSWVGGLLRVPWPFKKRRRLAGMIGCGQFAFSTIAHFVMGRGVGFASCFDVKQMNAKAFARFYGVKNISSSIDEFFLTPGLKKVFIASNHHSHAEYAIKALSKDLDVHIEKPISVTIQQFQDLLVAKENSNGSAVAGYNRPFSRAVQFVKGKILGNQEPLSLACFVSGHLIGPDHWYRHPKEGTRICGNVGHWIDLAIHLFSVRGLVPEKYFVSICYGNLLRDDRDDNISISISTDLGDLVNIFLGSRAEPFEGINETINLQSGKIIAKIDDFRRMDFWDGPKFKRLRFWPKDVGHKKTTHQILGGREQRDWSEVEMSTLLMLRIKQMVVKQKTEQSFEIRKELLDLKKGKSEGKEIDEANTAVIQKW